MIIKRTHTHTKYIRHFYYWKFKSFTVGLGFLCRNLCFSLNVCICTSEWYQTFDEWHPIQGQMENLGQILFVFSSLISFVCVCVCMPFGDYSLFYVLGIWNEFHQFYLPIKASFGAFNSIYFNRKSSSGLEALLINLFKCSIYWINFCYEKIILFLM